MTGRYFALITNKKVKPDKNTKNNHTVRTWCIFWTTFDAEIHSMYGSFRWGSRRKISEITCEILICNFPLTSRLAFFSSKFTFTTNIYLQIGCNKCGLHALCTTGTISAQRGGVEWVFAAGPGYFRGPIFGGPSTKGEKQF